MVSYELTVSAPRQVRMLQMLLFYSIAFLVAWLVSSDQPPAVLWPVTALALPLLLWLQWWEHKRHHQQQRVKTLLRYDDGQLFIAPHANHPALTLAAADIRKVFIGPGYIAVEGDYPIARSLNLPMQADTRERDKAIENIIAALLQDNPALAVIRE
jgi:hypothetical protein